MKFKQALSALILVLPLVAGAACSRPLRVPFEDWRPYSFIDASGLHTGLETELLAAVAKEVGCEVEYVQQVPRNRRLPMLASGELDLLIAASYDGPNAPDLAWYTKPYRFEEFGAFMLADAPQRPELKTLGDLLQARLSLLTQRGPDVVPIVEQFAAQNLVTRFEDYAKAVQLLKLKRGDVLIGDRYAVAYAAEAGGVALTELPVFVRRDIAAYKLSRKSFTEAEAAAFNQAIVKLESQGDLQRIRNRWMTGVVKPR